MQRVDSWAEWALKVFETAFVWFLIWLLVAFSVGPLLGEVGGWFLNRRATPAMGICFMLHVMWLWRKKPKPESTAQENNPT